MRLIARFTDLDILGTPGLSAASPRLTARAIVLSPNNRCAVMYAEKFGIYTLPGGGVEQGESLAEALHRELSEETGCSIAAIEPFGCVEENRAHADFTQLSCYYIVRTADETLRPRLTDSESANGTRVLWLTLEEAWQRITAPVFDCPQRKFLQARDAAVLKAYLSVHAGKEHP